MTQADTARFLSKVEKARSIPSFRPALGPCWIWQAAINSHGHGIFWFQGRLMTAHSAAYQMFSGPIADGLEIDHLCRVRACVNPAHLEAVTHKENMRRGFYGLQTHCPKGHPYSAGNLYVTPKGHRQCKICKRAAYLRFTAKQGARAA